MLELYVTLVKAGIRTIDSVPAAFREKVKAVKCYTNVVTVVANKI